MRELEGFSQDFLQMVVLYMIEMNRPSINRIQYQFKLGFNDALKLFDLLTSLEILKRDSKGMYIINKGYEDTINILCEYFQSNSVFKN